MGLKKRGRKKGDKRLVLIISIILILVLFFSLYILKIKVPTFKAPPSFHEIYGKMTCSNGISLNGKILNATVIDDAYPYNPIYSTTLAISNNFYDILVQGDTNDIVKFYIDYTEIANFNYVQFGYQEKNITIIDGYICYIPPSSTGGGSYGSGGSGGGDSGGGSGGSITTLTGSINVTSTPSGANIFLNGVFRGITRLTINDLHPGLGYTIELVEEGYQKYTKSVSVGAGTSSNLNVVLIKEPKIELPLIPEQFDKFIAKKEIITITFILIGLMVVVGVFSYFRLRKRH